MSQSRFKGSLIGLTEAGKIKSKKTIETLAGKLKSLGYDDVNVDKLVQDINASNNCNHKWLPTGEQNRYHKGSGKFISKVSTECCSKCGKQRHINPSNGKVVGVYEDKTDV